MMNLQIRAPHGARRLALLTLALTAALWVGGCAAQDTNLTLRSSIAGKNYDPQFTAAYAQRSADGVDVVLATDEPAAAESLPGAQGAQAAAGGSGAAAVGPAPGRFRQIMHIRVLWSPDSAMKVNSPAATNASIRWLVLHDTPKGTEMREYTGTGLAGIDAGDGTTTLTIRNARITPGQCRGGLCDPVGPATLKGAIVARNDPARVDELLSQVRIVLAAAAQRPIERASAAPTNAAGQATARVKP